MEFNENPLTTIDRMTLRKGLKEIISKLGGENENKTKFKGPKLDFN